MSFGKILLSCVVMGFTIMYLKDHLHFILTIPIAMMVYISFLYLIGGIHKNDIFQLRDLLLKRA